jgi:hypothetical protein
LLVEEWTRRRLEKASIHSNMIRRAWFVIVEVVAVNESEF